jgi:hypothetical protein
VNRMSGLTGKAIRSLGAIRRQRHAAISRSASFACARARSSVKVTVNFSNGS